MHSFLADVKMSSRSMGVKLVVVSFLALAMTVPALFVWSLIDDRANRAAQVVKEVGGLVGGPQTFLGPILSVPYLVPSTSVKPADRGTYLIFPIQAEAAIRTQAEVRHRSLFKVPVYQANVTFDASFDLGDTAFNAPYGAVFDWSRAEFLVGVTDARGAQSDATIASGDKVETLVPAATLSGANFDVQQGGDTQLTFFGAPAAMATPGAKFDAKATLQFTGAQRLAVLAFGKTTAISVSGNWPNPSFNGNFLPVSRTINGEGFEAKWLVPFIARGVPAEGPSAIIKYLGRTAVGVSLVDLAEPYQSVTRSLKYAVLFIGLVFLSYFLFEISTGKRIHPAQYILIGVAQLVFYLLLLSIAERLGFDLAFTIAAIATVGLISSYAGWVFGDHKFGLRALASFASLYALIYWLLRSEDQALLIGAIASFVAIAAIMYFTRHMDWYSSSPVASSSRVGENPAGGCA